MSYMLLIVEPVGQRRERTEDEGRALYDSMLKFSADLKARGLLTVSQSLRSDAEAVRVQVRQGKRTLIDGPFAEAKEMVGGYFLLTCKSREEAVAIAAECPAAQWATVEVREFGPCFT
ncbi:MAG TPA: YciI family protein [Burkholderiaceae bacterium]|nr:YciI family protein [Burkholderiaceae bacterium]